MIQLSQIADASPEVQQRAKRTRAFERGNRVLVAPLDEQKALRLVEFNGTYG